MIHICSDNSNSTLSIYTEDQVQPNAVDIRVEKIFKVKQDEWFLINEDRKMHRGAKELEPTLNAFDHLEWRLEPGVYEVEAEGIVSIADGESGFVITRSTLNRNGVFLTSGLYDSNYTGPMSMVMHVCGPMIIERGTRVGQFVLFKAETLNLYQGDYGLNKDGTAKQMESNYRESNKTK